MLIPQVPTVDWANTSSDAVRLQSKWSSLTYLQEACPDALVEVSASVDGYLKGTVEDHETLTMWFGDFVSRVLPPAPAKDDRSWRARPSQLRLHLAQCPLALLPAFERDAMPPPHSVRTVSGSSTVHANLWFSVGSTTSSMHFDCYSNVLLVVRGVKRFLLLPPAAGRALRPRAAHGPSANHTTLSSAEVLAAVSALGASAMRIDVTAGHAVFIPEGWWHQVESPEDVTIAVNYWWHGECEQLLQRTCAARAEPTLANASEAVAGTSNATCYLLRRSFELAVRDEVERLIEIATTEPHPNTTSEPRGGDAVDLGQESSTTTADRHADSSTTTSSQAERRSDGAAGCSRCLLQSQHVLVGVDEQQHSPAGDKAGHMIEDANGDHAAASRRALASHVFDAMDAATIDEHLMGRHQPRTRDRPAMLRVLRDAPSLELLASLASCAHCKTLAPQVRSLLTARLGPVGAHLMGQKCQQAQSSACVRCAARAVEHIDAIFEALVSCDASSSSCADANAMCDVSLASKGEAHVDHRERLLGLAAELADQAAANVLRETLGLGRLLGREGRMSEGLGAGAGGGGGSGCELDHPLDTDERARRVNEGPNQKRARLES